MLSLRSTGKLRLPKRVRALGAGGRRRRAALSSLKQQREALHLAFSLFEIVSSLFLGQRCSFSSLSRPSAAKHRSSSRHWRCQIAKKRRQLPTVDLCHPAVVRRRSPSATPTLDAFSSHHSSKPTAPATAASAPTSPRSRSSSVLRPTSARPRPRSRASRPASSSSPLT